MGEDVTGIGLGLVIGVGALREHFYVHSLICSYVSMPCLQSEGGSLFLSRFDITMYNS